MFFSNFTIFMPSEETLNPVGELADVEVDQQSLANPRELQVGQHLRVMQRQQSFNALELDQESTFDDQVGSVCAGDPHAAVDQRQWHLPFEAEQMTLQFINQTSFVD